MAGTIRPRSGGTDLSRCGTSGPSVQMCTKSNKFLHGVMDGSVSAAKNDEGAIGMFPDKQKDVCERRMLCGRRRTLHPPEGGGGQSVSSLLPAGSLFPVPSTSFIYLQLPEGQWDVTFLFFAFEMAGHGEIG